MDLAIIMAERKFKSYDLGSVREVELVTSSQPCIQCYGALIWAGINKVVIGARGETVKKLQALMRDLFLKIGGKNLKCVE
ncbi:MAG: hypothetical protein ACRCTS_08000 [Fusobacteriaceae bacterium]